MKTEKQVTCNMSGSVDTMKKHEAEDGDGELWGSTGWWLFYTGKLSLISHLPERDLCT